MVIYPRRAPVECLPHQHTNICPCRWQISDYAAGSSPPPLRIIIIGADDEDKKKGKTYDTTWVVTETRTSVLLDVWWCRKSNLYLPCLSLYVKVWQKKKKERNEIPGVGFIISIDFIHGKVKRMCDATTHPRPAAPAKWMETANERQLASLSGSGCFINEYTHTPQPCRSFYVDEREKGMKWLIIYYYI